MINVTFSYSHVPLPKITVLFCRTFLYRKFSTTLHSAAYLSRRGAKNALLFFNTLCHFKCFHTLGYHPHIDDSSSHSVICFERFSPSFSLPIPTFPRTSYVRVPSPAHCPPLPTSPPWLKADQPLPLAFCRGVGPLTTANIQSHRYTAIKATLDATSRNKRKSWGKPEMTG